MKKKVFGMFLVLAACMALFCITASAATTVKVGGSETMENNPAVKVGTVTWDPVTQTLTLTNARIETTGYGIQFLYDNANQEITVKLEGTNTLTVNGNQEGSAIGIDAEYSVIAGDSSTIKFTGGGSLQIKLQEKEQPVTDATGIVTNCVHLNIEDVTLDVECCDAQNNSIGLILSGVTGGGSNLTIGEKALVQIKTGAAESSRAISYRDNVTITPPILVPANGKMESGNLLDGEGNVAKEALIGSGLTPITVKAPEGVTYTTRRVLLGGYGKPGEAVYVETALPTGYQSEFKLTGATAAAGGDDPGRKTADVGFLVGTDPITVEISFQPYDYEIDFYNNDGTEEYTSVQTAYDKDVYIADHWCLVPGKYITGYNTMADGTGESYQLRTTVKNLTAEKMGVVKLYAQWADLPFRDVTKTDWFLKEVSYAYQRGMILGTELDQFSPEMELSRSMVVQILYRLEGEPQVTADNPFEDVAADYYALKAITWAAENDIVKGYGDNRFGPEDDVTREQLAAILYRYADYAGLDVTAAGDLTKFPDGNKIESYALEPMKWAVGKGIIQGHDTGLLAPQDGATRAEASAMLYRLCTMK